VGVSSAVGVLAAAVVLFIAFGSLLAMVLPIVTAIAGVGKHHLEEFLAREQ
jgi:RND superfamily putative drug exporter